MYLSRKLLSAVFGLLTLGASMAAGTGAATAGPSEGHEVHIAVKKITVIKDGDLTVTGDCGEVYGRISAYPQTDWVSPNTANLDNGNIFESLPSTPDKPFYQDYCAGSTYIPSLTNANKVVLVDNNDSTYKIGVDPFNIEVTVQINEYDELTQVVSANKRVVIPVPPVGQMKDLVLRVKETNEFGTVDMIVEVRARTF